MYAVVKTGGKQYKVTVGEKLKVEQIPAELDSQIELNEVLMIADGESVKVPCCPSIPSRNCWMTTG